jgi:hypothetical protein
LFDRSDGIMNNKSIVAGQKCLVKQEVSVDTAMGLACKRVCSCVEV